jgi:PhzF family phenazine biosynthesis protein
MPIERWAAFTTDPHGGNPAGVVRDAAGLDDAAMQRIAAELGYSETAFVTGRGPDGARRVRYFTPLAEIPFCGHATIATALAIATAGRPGAIDFDTPVGRVSIETREDEHGLLASFTSVEPATAQLTEQMLADTLDLIDVAADALDPRFPPLQAYAGNWHPVLVLAERDVFDGFGFDPARARAVLDRYGWPATITVLHSGTAERWHARNLFPVGGITEDPATGAAAAAVGGYLRALGAAPASGRIVIAQGGHVGRPSELTVDIPPAGGIVVSGRGVPDPI